MRGIADGAGLDVQDVIVANFIPELFHCSGFALSGSATKDGTLYHGRILDYGCDWRLQEHAVLTVAEPRGQDPVRERDLCRVRRLGHRDERRAGLDRRDGGQGAGPLGRRADGLPGPDGAGRGRSRSTEAIAIFRDHPRTCEYYFVIADGKTGKAVGMEASWNVFGVIGMGESHPRLPDAIKDAVVLSAGDRYKELVRRVKEGHGKFDAESARHLMDRPVAMKSNLHSVLFETTTGSSGSPTPRRTASPPPSSRITRFNFPSSAQAPGRSVVAGLACRPAAPRRAAQTRRPARSTMTA